MKHSTLFPMFLYPMLLYPVLVALVLCSAPPLVSAAKVGGAAPDFTGTASTGKTFRLSDYRGKYVVLEWHNNGCPFVRKQYNSGNMQQLQKEWTSQRGGDGTQVVGDPQPKFTGFPPGKP